MSGRSRRATCNKSRWGVVKSTRLISAMGPPPASSRDGGIEIQAVGQPGGHDRKLFLGLEHVGPPALPLGECPVGIGVAALADLGVMPRDLDDVVHLLFRESLGLEDRLVAEQLDIEIRDVEQDFVRGCLRVELGADHPLLCGQRLEDGVGERSPDVNARKLCGSGGDDTRSRADVERLLG